MKNEKGMEFDVKQTEGFILNSVEIHNQYRILIDKN